MNTSFKYVFANDILKHSKEFYDIKHTTKLHLEDLNNINSEDIPAHDILCVGFPC